MIFTALMFAQSALSHEFKAAESASIEYQICKAVAAGKLYRSFDPADIVARAAKGSCLKERQKYIDACILYKKISGRDYANILESDKKDDESLISFIVGLRSEYSPKQ